MFQDTWAGKTIALGTFPTAEADDKCARAKALTRAWRSTMRPKPTREWVMLELERLDVRVVSGRVAQKETSTSDSDNDDDQNPAGTSRGSSKNTSQQQQQQQQQQQLTDDLLNQHRRNSITASLLNVADFARGNDRRSSLASMDSNFFFNRASLGLGPGLGLNRNGSLGGDQTPAAENKDISTEALIPAVRPYVGGGPAAAYEATREDYYRKVAEQRKSQNKDGGAAGGVIDRTTKNLTGGRGSIGGLSSDSTALGSLNQIGAGVGGMNQQMNLPMSLPTNASKHYEMLKLHHMNLLNEIQETTLMMNLYQQQHLQQQLQHEQLSKNRLVDPQLSLLSQQQHLLAGAGGLSQDGGLNQRAGSLGLGSLMGQRNSLSQVGVYAGNDVVLPRRRSSGNNSGGSNSNINNNSSIEEAIKLELGPVMDQQHSTSQIRANIGNDASGSARHNESNSSAGDKHSIIKKNPEETIIDNMNENNISETISNGSIAGNSNSDHISSPACNLPSSANNTNIVKSNDEISTLGNAPVPSMHDNQLKRIKDEIAERQRLVDQLERMEPKQKRAKIEI